MARLHKSFQVKLDTAMNQVVEDAYADLEMMTACAGIRDNPDAAFKARKNHYGFHTRGGGYAPPRPVISRATVGGDAVDMLAELIHSRLQAAQSQKRYENTTTRFGEPVVVRHHRRARAFGGQTGQRNDAKRIMTLIARQMVDNQRAAIDDWSLAENARSTRKQKGMSKPPMYHSGEVRMSLEGWVDGAD